MRDVSFVAGDITGIFSRVLDMEVTNYYRGFSNKCFETEEDSIGYSIFVSFWGYIVFWEGCMYGIIMIDFSDCKRWQDKYNIYILALGVGGLLAS
jgi:hypothetical protein